MKKHLILLGAGFNYDVPSIIKITNPDFHKYPLVGDISKICGYKNEPNTTIEEQLANDINNGNEKPLKQLRDHIMGADYYLVPPLLEKNPTNCYRDFFDKFKGHQFLTFNYDSLVELFLMHLGYWNPGKGYGVTVKFEWPAEHERQEAAGQRFDQLNKLSKVLHLHGTFCVYTSDYEIVAQPNNCSLIQDRQTPLFIFDPDSISPLFPKYKRCLPTTGYVHTLSRIIAPVPDKIEGFKNLFIKKMYGSATKLIKESGKLIVIGYSFNQHDKESYSPIIHALSEADNPTMLVISPNADKSCEHIKTELAQNKIKLIIKNQAFREWVADGMPDK